MEFRPCIDIHNGKVKQIVGGSLKDEGNMADENFVSMQDAAFYFIKCERQRILRGDKETGGECVTGVSERPAGWRRHHG